MAFVKYCIKSLFLIEDKHTIKVLRQQKLYGATKILRMFSNKNWTLSGVKTVLSKIDATGSIEHCSGNGWPRTACSADTIKDMAAEQSDLNPVDYAVWGILQERVYKRHRIMDVEELRQRVEDEWDRLHQEVIDNAISEWHKRLTACTAAAVDILNIHSEHYCICSHTD